MKTTGRNIEVDNIDINIGYNRAVKAIQKMTLCQDNCASESHRRGSGVQDRALWTRL